MKKAEIFCCLLFASLCVFAEINEDLFNNILGDMYKPPFSILNEYKGSFQEPARVPGEYWIRRNERTMEYSYGHAYDTIYSIVVNINSFTELDWSNLVETVKKYYGTPKSDYGTYLSWSHIGNQITVILIKSNDRITIMLQRVS